MTQGQVASQMIDRVERLVLNDCRIKVAELASERGISNGNVCTIIHEHLGIQMAFRWRYISEIFQGGGGGGEFGFLSPPLHPPMVDITLVFWYVHKFCIYLLVPSLQIINS